MLYRGIAWRYIGYIVATTGVQRVSVHTVYIVHCVQCTACERRECPAACITTGHRWIQPYYRMPVWMVIVAWNSCSVLPAASVQCIWQVPAIGCVKECVYLKLRLNLETIRIAISLLWFAMEIALKLY